MDCSKAVEILPLTHTADNRMGYVAIPAFGVRRLAAAFKEIVNNFQPIGTKSLNRLRECSADLGLEPRR